MTVLTIICEMSPRDLQTTRRSHYEVQYQWRAIALCISPLEKIFFPETVRDYTYGKRDIRNVVCESGLRPPANNTDGPVSLQADYHECREVEKYECISKIEFFGDVNHLMPWARNSCALRSFLRLAVNDIITKKRIKQFLAFPLSVAQCPVVGGGRHSYKNEVTWKTVYNIFRRIKPFLGGGILPVKATKCSRKSHRWSQHEAAWTANLACSAELPEPNVLAASHFQENKSSLKGPTV